MNQAELLKKIDEKLYEIEKLLEIWRESRNPPPKKKPSPR